MSLKYNGLGVNATGAVEDLGHGPLLLQEINHRETSKLESNKQEINVIQKLLKAL